MMGIQVPRHHMQRSLSKTSDHGSLALNRHTLLPDLLLLLRVINLIYIYIIYASFRQHMMMLFLHNFATHDGISVNFDVLISKCNIKFKKLLKHIISINFGFFISKCNIKLKTKNETWCYFRKFWVFISNVALNSKQKTSIFEI